MTQKFTDRLIYTIYTLPQAVFLALAPITAIWAPPLRSPLLVASWFVSYWIFQAYYKEYE